MNFYTLTSKQKLFVAFGLVLLMLIMLNLLLSYVADRQSSQTRYINDKFSKLKHFGYQKNLKKDIVFIGSSRTFYHISTNAFKKHGIDIYNFGVSGSKLPDYPTVIHEVIPQEPKHVVLSLRVDKLYEALSVSDYPSLQELNYYAEVDMALFLKASLNYLINFHTLLQYSEPIYHKIETFYKKFDFGSTHAHNDSNQSQKLNLPNHKVYSNELYSNELYSNEVYSKRVGCEVFDAKQTSDKHITLKCTNGDGIIIGSDMREPKETVNPQLTELNPDSLKYLNQMIQNLNANDIKVTLILEPILDNRFHYSLVELREALHDIKVIDLTNYALSYDTWADRRHLNYLGREQYSEHLIKMYLKNLL